MTTSSEADRPLRADAERNRRRILQAAGEVFAERGLDVSLDEIAAAAGVGVGTVYRRFPNKDVLIDALFERKIDDVVEVAEHALEVEDPLEGLRQFMFAMCRLQEEDRGLKETLLSRDRGTSRLGHGKERIAPLAMRIFERAKAAGAIRADLDGYDVPLLHMAIGHVADRTREADPAYWERLLTIVIDGMRPRDGETPLPAAPLGHEGFQAAMTSRRC